MLQSPIPNPINIRVVFQDMKFVNTHNLSNVLSLCPLCTSKIQKHVHFIYCTKKLNVLK